MRTRSLILATLFLAGPAVAQEACEQAAECRAGDAPRVVTVPRALPASFSQETRPVALVAADRGYLGVRLATDEEGMRILEVIPGSGAAEAGLQAGDRILTLAGTSTTEASVQEALQGLEAGETVKITYDRGGETRKAKVTLKTLAEMEAGLEEEPEEILEEPSAVAETPEIEWITNLEQDLAEEMADLEDHDEEISDFTVALDEGHWATIEVPSEAAASDRGYLGVSLDTSGDGMAILDVYEGSGAAKAGLRAGDVLLQFDGRKGGPQDQLEYIRGKKVGDEVQVRYRRGEDLGRTKITLGPLREEGIARFGIAQAGPEGPTRVRVVPEIQWDTRKQTPEIVRRATEEGETGEIWITTVGPEGHGQILRGGDGQGRVQLFTTREGNQIRIDAVLEEDEHGEHEHAEHEHEDHEHEDHDGDGQRRIVIRHIGNRGETVEEYSFGDGDHDGLPDHVREMLHRHLGELHDDAKGDDTPRRLPRAGLRQGEGREGNRMIFVPEGGGRPIEVEAERIEWTERAPAAPRRPAARAQDRLQELQQRVRQLERRIAELERALERTAERPRERRIRWER